MLYYSVQLPPPLLLRGPQTVQYCEGSQGHMLRRQPQTRSLTVSHGHEGTCGKEGAMGRKGLLVSSEVAYASLKGTRTQVGCRVALSLQRSSP